MLARYDDGMRRPFFVFALAFAGLGLALAQESSPPAQPAKPPKLAKPLKAALETIKAADIQKHVDYLASDELEGRFANSLGARAAAVYVEKHFSAAGLEPLGEGSTFAQPLAKGDLAPNVVGLCRGSGAGFVLITAHYDHLAPRKKGEDRIYNGADDNASGTAALLEIAEALSKLDERPSSSIVLVAFNGEEVGLVGSRHFVAHPPFPLAEIRGVVNLDMISRGQENVIFCEGEARAPLLAAALRRANEFVGLEIRWNEHPAWLRQSDQYAFLEKSVPALYLGVEDHEDYHETSDHADKILAGLAEKVTRLAFLAALDAASEER